jgi:ribonuclease BN (tRNA processing enzyme)
VTQAHAQVAELAAVWVSHRHADHRLSKPTHPTPACAQVAELAAVWVSHRHADHLAGLPGLLAARPAAASPLLARSLACL